MLSRALPLNVVPSGQEFWGWLSSALILLSFLGLSNLYLRYMVRRKTRELREALADLRATMTSREEADKLVQEHHQTLLKFVKHSPIYTYIKEVDGATSRMLVYSDNFKNLLDQKSASGSDGEEALSAEFVALISAGDQAVMASNTPQTFEEDIMGRHYVAIKFPIEMGERRLLAGYAIDVTQHKQSEAEKERLLLAIEQANETVVITDSRGVIVYVNPFFTRITGYTRDEALGQNPRVLKSGHHDAAFFKNMWAKLSSGEPWSGQIVNKRKDGSLYTEQATISPVRDRRGKIVNYVAVKRDISEQLRIAAEHTAMESQLMHMQKLESLGRLSGGIAHDFNNILQAIIGYAELALMDAIPGRPLHHDLSEIKKAAERATSLTKQLQVFARKELISTKAMDMNGTIAAMLDMLRRLTHGRATIEWHPGDSVGDVLFDEGQLDQILVNMVTNACDASGSEPCVITLSTHVISVTLEKTVSLGLGAAGEYVQLTISDNGSGMSEEIMPHIFEPFYTTKPMGAGTGLGLAIVYGIVKKNGGHISVVSKPNKGTQFDIYLPLCKDAVSAAATAEPAKPIAQKTLAGQGKTVVVVDDEEAVSHLMGSALERRGYKVLKFFSAVEALAMSPEQWRGVDLVISDVLMPKMNGVAFVELLLQQHPALKYMFVSGHTSNLLTKNNTLIDKTNFMRKPFTPAQLVQKVAEILTAATRQ